MSEIEQTKMIRIAEIRLVVARKMKEAARATEAFALAEINVLSNHDSSPGNQVTLSFEEYTALTGKARDAEEQSKKRVASSMLEVDETSLSNMDILKRVEEATEEVKTSKKALEEALEGDPRLLDVNGLHLVNDEAKPVKPTLSIGQILSRKLLQPQEFEAGEGISMKQNVPLGQMLDNRTMIDQLTDKLRKKLAISCFLPRERNLDLHDSHIFCQNRRRSQP
ncbi:hypothetical protein JHK85_054081 [Glycine max]|nr:hypothetical protein JHK85_054081 [Glycine max]